jgi:hypothetical protein
MGFAAETIGLLLTGNYNPFASNIVLERWTDQAGKQIMNDLKKG